MAVGSAESRSATSRGHAIGRGRLSGVHLAQAEEKLDDTLTTNTLFELARGQSRENSSTKRPFQVT